LHARERFHSRRSIYKTTIISLKKEVLVWSSSLKKLLMKANGQSSLEPTLSTKIMEPEQPKDCKPFREPSRRSHSIYNTIAPYHTLPTHYKPTYTPENAKQNKVPYPLKTHK